MYIAYLHSVTLLDNFALELKNPQITHSIHIVEHLPSVQCRNKPIPGAPASASSTESSFCTRTPKQHFLQIPMHAYASHLRLKVTGCSLHKSINPHCNLRRSIYCTQRTHIFDLMILCPRCHHEHLYSCALYRCSHCTCTVSTRCIHALQPPHTCKKPFHFLIHFKKHVAEKIKLISNSFVIKSNRSRKSCRMYLCASAPEAICLA